MASARNVKKNNSKTVSPKGKKASSPSSKAKGGKKVAPPKKASGKLESLKNLLLGSSKGQEKTTSGKKASGTHKAALPVSVAAPSKIKSGGAAKAGKVGKTAHPSVSEKGSEKGKAGSKAGKGGSAKGRARSVLEVTTKRTTAAFVNGRLTVSDPICREPGCESLSTTATYCRLHYIKNWKKIKRKELILKERKLNQYIEELVAKYPDKYIEAIRQDLANDKEFSKVIHDLELDESIDDFEGEGADSAEAIIDNIKRDFDDEGDAF